jgi:2,3-bisphosphoglycerate-dependent phosphoglycerate mutase
MQSPAARLWLVRHGQTDWNAAGRVQGHTPTELNAQGLAEARALATTFSQMQHSFAACYSSDLPRAAQTAQVIAEKLQLPVQTTPALRERSFGEYEGATSEQVRAARAALGLHQTGDLADWTGMPGIESNETLWQRIAGYLREISDRHGSQDVLVITHGGVILRAVYRALAIPDGTPRHFPLSNGIVAVLQWRADSFYLLSLADMNLLLGSAPSIDTARMAPAGP